MQIGDTVKIHNGYNKWYNKIYDEKAPFRDGEMVQITSLGVTDNDFFVRSFGSGATAMVPVEFLQESGPFKN